MSQGCLSTDLRQKTRSVGEKPSACVTTGSKSRGAPPQLPPGRGGRGCAAPCSRRPPGLTPRARTDLSQPGHAHALGLRFRRQSSSEGGQGPLSVRSVVRSGAPRRCASVVRQSVRSLAGSCALPSIHPCELEAVRVTSTPNAGLRRAEEWEMPPV